MRTSCQQHLLGSARSTLHANRSCLWAQQHACGTYLGAQQMPRELRGTRSSATASWIALFTSAWLVMIGGLINCARPAFEMEQACGRTRSRAVQRWRAAVVVDEGTFLLTGGTGLCHVARVDFRQHVCGGVLSILRHCSGASGKNFRFRYRAALQHDTPCSRCRAEWPCGRGAAARAPPPAQGKLREQAADKEGYQKDQGCEAAEQSQPAFRLTGMSHSATV